MKAARSSPAWARAARWLLVREAMGLPVLWIILGLAVAWTLRAAMLEIGIAADTASHSAISYELAFLAVVASGALCLAHLSRHRWLWAPLGRHERAGAELAFLAAYAAVALALAWIPALPQRIDLPWGRAATTLVHVIALVQLVSRLPALLGPSPLLLVAIVWWIPALVGGAGGIAGKVASILVPTGGDPMQTLGPADMAPAVAFGLAAWLLTPRNPRP